MSSLQKWHGKVAVVTGASKGIGFAIVKRLAESGLKVVGLSRNITKLEELSKTIENKDGKLYAISTDITKEKDILKAFQWIKDNVGPIHILINNAGAIRFTTLASGETKHWKEVLDTNILGLCIATREAIQDMKANKVDGHIIHMNSICGHIAVQADIYSASKFAVTALTETLRQELNSLKSKIKITSISPGYVNTEFVRNNCLEMGMSNTPKELTDAFSKMPSLDSEDIVDAVVYVLGTPPHVQVHEIIIRPVGER